MFGSFIDAVYKTTGRAAEKMVLKTKPAAAKKAVTGYGPAMAKVMADAEPAAQKARLRAAKATKAAEAAKVKAEEAAKEAAKAAKKAAKTAAKLATKKAAVEANAVPPNPTAILAKKAEHWEELFAKTGDAGRAAYELVQEIRLEQTLLDDLVNSAKVTVTHDQTVDIIQFTTTGVVIHRGFDRSDLSNLEVAVSRLMRAMVVYGGLELFVDFYFDAVAAAKAMRKHSRRDMITQLLDEADEKAAEVTAAKKAAHKPKPAPKAAQAVETATPKPTPATPPAPEPAPEPEAAAAPEMDDAAQQAVADEHRRATEEQLEALAHGFSNTRSDRRSRKGRR